MIRSQRLSARRKQRPFSGTIGSSEASGGIPSEDISGRRTDGSRDRTAPGRRYFASHQLSVKRGQVPAREVESLARGTAHSTKRRLLYSLSSMFGGRFARGLCEYYEYGARFHLHRIGFQIDAGGPALRFARREIESSVVFRALDDATRDKPICQQSLLMRAQPIGREIAIVGGAIDGIAVTIVIKADDVLRADILGPASRRPSIQFHRIHSLFSLFD